MADRRPTVEERLKSIVAESTSPQVEDNVAEVIPGNDSIDTPVAVPEDIRKPVEPVEPTREDLPEEPPTKDDPKANQVWKDLRAKAKLAEQYEQEVAEYKTKLESSSQATPEQMEQLKQLELDLAKEREERATERDKFDNEFGKIDITRQRAFKHEYDEKLNQSLSWASNVIQRRGDLDKAAADAVIKKAFTIQDARQRAAYLMDEIPEVQAIVDNELMKADMVREQRLAAIDNWRATKAQLQDTEERLSAAQSTQNLEQTLAGTFDELSKSGSYYYEQSKGTSPASQEWNRAIETRQLAVKQVMLKQDSKEIARYVADGFTARNVRGDLQTTEKKLAEARAEIKSLKALKPQVDGRRPLAPNHVPQAEEGERMSVTDRVKMIARTDYSK